ncbi:bis(5'-nucleosyl)-tetraphosphatase (symmetrical) YqeK [Virgibacillus salarius]|uniref:bis(5'-nucleosyl)-tetraphosphatase (symmetrical) YqeK n=1 Tax=Virgibacillus salarius TaxID=447199 RepID=UPI00249336BD|nr:bis(5'-nucleosyl)-tetraphosphatase (symmetrical) YqeK [Virgibacillus salarius]WBX79081.1 bis(5'-nucleosyl)-tetraphosphatase (symmetrical) YqeK [Virgibacillus salarius]
MKIEIAKDIVKPHLTTARYEHSLRVAETAKELALLYGEKVEKAELAAVFHDYAKYRSRDELARWIVTSYLPKDLLDYHHELWHGPVAALLIEKEFGVKDIDIQNAIHYHTTGRAHMSNLEMIIFLADYIEPGRKFTGIDKVREMAKVDLVHACLMASANTIRFLMNKNTAIYPDTFHTYNDLIRRVNGGNH